jgi:hypothetical protein
MVAETEAEAMRNDRVSEMLLDSRYSFTQQFLCSSAIFARRCAEIELAYPDSPEDHIRTEHLGLVTTAIMHCAAAVEAQTAELIMHGPGYHLGSSGVDARAHDRLKPWAKTILDRQEPLERCNLILLVLEKPLLVPGGPPWQDMQTLAKLRNPITHYKSYWGKQKDQKNLLEALKNLRLTPPPFNPPPALFFPHQFLGAACAAWSVRTAVKFIKAFYKQLGIESPLEPFMPQFEGLL